MTHTVTLWPPKKRGIAGYIKSFNMDTRGDDLAPMSVAVAAGDTNGSVARTAPVWTFNGLTCAAFGEYKHLRHYTSATNPELDVANPIVDLCLFSSAAGADCLLVSYGTADFIDSYDNTGTPAASTDTKITYMTMAGADLYGVCDLGAYNTWNISKCPSGSNPLTATNWSDGVPVGNSCWPIVQLRQVNGGVIAAKGDGLYKWNENLSKYENLLPWLERCPDPLNGVGMFAVKDGVCYPTADGALYHFDGHTVDDISPKKYHTPHRYNTHLRSRLTAGVEADNWVYVATEPCSVGWTHNAGIKVFTYDPTAYTDITANLIDGLPSTSVSVAGLGSGEEHSLFVGAEFPFLAVKFLIGTANTAADVWTAVKYDSGVGAPNNWFSVTPRDGTAQAGATLSRDGVVVSAPGSNLYTWAKTTINSESKYWWQFTIGNTGLAAGTTLRGIAILPARKLRNDLLPTTADDAGAVGHVLAGRRSGSEWEWHDVGCFWRGTIIDAMAYGVGFTGSATTPDAAMLLAIGQFDRDYLFPGVAVYNPSIPPVGSYAPRFYPAPVDLADEGYRTAVKTAKKYRIVTNYVQSDDRITVEQRFDHKVWDTVASAAYSGPSELDAPAHAKGLRLETMLSLTDNDDDSVNGPSISAVEVDLEVLEGVPYSDILEHDESTPLSE